MPLPPPIVARVLETVIELSKTAFRGAKLTRKVDVMNAGGYVVRIVRRGSIGANGATSQMVKMFRNGKLAAVWHVVVKAGKVIHRDVKKILTKP